MRQILIVTLLLLSSAPAMAIYKCEKDGRVIYSDELCPGAKLVDLTEKDSSDKSAAQIAKSLNAQKANKARHPGRREYARRDEADKKVRRATRTAENTVNPAQTSSGR